MLISLTSSDTCDHIFRSHDGTSENVGKGSKIFGKARGKKRGEGWVGEEKKEGGVGGGRKEKKRGEVGGGRKKEGWGGWVMTSSKKYKK